MSARQNPGKPEAGRRDNHAWATRTSSCCATPGEAFAAGDLEAASAALDAQVRWYAAEEPDADGTCHNHGEALAFIQMRAPEHRSGARLLRTICDRRVRLDRTIATPYQCRREAADQPDGSSSSNSVAPGGLEETPPFARERER